MKAVAQDRQIFILELDRQELQDLSIAVVMADYHRERAKFIPENKTWTIFLETINKLLK